MKRFDKLEMDNVKLLHVISCDEDQDETIKAKKQFHKNKLEMLELIHASEKINCKSARSLFKEVANKPKVPRYAVGIAPIDAKLNGGIEIGTLLILAGESFTGKTTLMLEILANVSEGSEVVLLTLKWEKQE
jgi:predicted ATP-dependent serine protease